MNHKILVFLGLWLLSFSVQAKTWIISPRDSIAASINKASAFDTLLLKEGIYRETLILVDKPLVILGGGNAVLDAEGGEEIMVIDADSTLISGLTFKNVGVSFMKDRSALRLRRVRHVTVKNNRFLNTFFGVYVMNSEDCRVEGNEFYGEAKDEVHAGNAIHIWKATRMEVLNNLCINHRDGIYFEFVDESLIRGNVSQDNMRYGLHFMFSNYDIYEDNRFENNGSGVAVMFSKHIRMLRNEFVDNWGGASYGILLKEISDGLMEGNRFENNTVGVYAEGANRIKITHNDFVTNGKALDIKGNCLDNEILANNFIGNTFEVLTNTKSNLNHYEGNYWGQYRGYDLDNDGIGDVPHRPVSLFAMITDKIPAANIFLHSPMMNSLDMAERVFPQMIPEQLIDKKPKMKPIEHD